MSFIVTILGSSSALPTSKRYPSAHVLNVHEHFFLFDCGEGTQLQIRKYKIPFNKINHIFISHLHGDHVFGLFGLLSTLNLLGRKRELFIYGHTSLNSFIQFFIEKFGTDFQFKIVFKEIGSKHVVKIYEDKHITIKSVPLKHRIPAIGFIVKEKEKPLNIRKEYIEKYNLSIKEIINIKEGMDYIDNEGNIIPNIRLTYSPYKTRSYAYISDTRYCKRIVPHIMNVDILYHEATFSVKDQKLATQTYHSSAEDAAKIALEAKVGKLIIGHFSARYKNTDILLDEAKKIFTESFSAEEGTKFSIIEERKSL